MAKKRDRDVEVNRDRMQLFRLWDTERWINLLACDAFDPLVGSIAYCGNLRGRLCRDNRGHYDDDLRQRCENALRENPNWIFLPGVKQWHRLSEVGEVRLTYEPSRQLEIRYTTGGYEIFAKHPEDQDVLAAELGFTEWLKTSRAGREELCHG